MSSSKWYQNNPGKATEHNKKYLSKEENRLKNKEYKAKWFQQNKVRKKQEQEKESKDPKEHIRIAIRRRKSQTKNKNYDFNIELEDLEIPTHCPILGLELTFGKGIKVRETSATLDRIDSSKGYVKGNVQIISYRANRIKNDATLDELIKLGEWASNEIFKYR